MTHAEELAALASELSVECAIGRDHGGFVLTMSTGEVEHCRALEDAYHVLCAYAPHPEHGEG